MPKGRTVTVIIDDLCTIAHKTSAQKYISDIEVEDVGHEVKNFTNQILKYRIYKLNLKYLHNNTLIQFFLVKKYYFFSRSREGSPLPRK